MQQTGTELTICIYRKQVEFRMVGSQDSIAQPNVVLNTIVAEAFAEAVMNWKKQMISIWQYMI